MTLHKSHRGSFLSHLELCHVSPEVHGEPQSKTVSQGKWAVRLECGLSLETRVTGQEPYHGLCGEGVCTTGHTQRLPADIGISGLELPLVSFQLPWEL